MSLKTLYYRHEQYFSSSWTVALILGYIFAFLDLIEMLIQSVSEKNVAGVVFVFLFQSVIMAFRGIINSVFFMVVIFILSFIPYLIIRGLKK